MNSNSSRNDWLCRLSKDGFMVGCCASKVPESKPQYGISPGPWYLRTLQRVLPSSWTSAQVLPVTMPGKDHPRGDSAAADDLISGQRRRALKKGLKSFKLDMRRGLVTFAVL